MWWERVLVLGTRGASQRDEYDEEEEGNLVEAEKLREQYDVAFDWQPFELRPGEVLPVDAAVGRVSAESIAGYPPGIPALLPGERITAEVVEYLRALAAEGARLHGASDPGFQTITVVR